jgi:Histidine kinase-, DNA gyrase B-, and HSP90-like ATPase
MTRGVRLTWQVAPKLPDVLVGDADGLCQVVAPLVGNAIKFTVHGEVAVHVAMAAQAAAAITVHLTVRDPGIGILAATQQLIFELFTQADGSMTRQHGSIGLGLTLARRLVDLIGGQLWVQSTLGQGSTFHCTLRFNDRRTQTLPRSSPHAGISRWCEKPARLQTLNRRIIRPSLGLDVPLARLLWCVRGRAALARIAFVFAQVGDRDLVIAASPWPTPPASLGRPRVSGSVWLARERAAWG